MIGQSTSKDTPVLPKKSQILKTHFLGMLFTCQEVSDVTKTLDRMSESWVGTQKMVFTMLYMCA